MSTDRERGPGYPDQDDRDRRVVQALRHHPDLVAAVEALRSDPDVVSAAVMPGLIKTDPPMVELVIEFRVGVAVDRRVYDVLPTPGVGCRVQGRHGS